MSVWNVKPKSGGEYEIPPAGSHTAALVGLIDLGTHRTQFGDQPAKAQHQVFLVWELLDEKTTEGKAFFIGRRYTLSLNEKSNLGKMIGNWRGKALGKDEEFDIRILLGKACLLSITRETSNAGNEFASVAGASQLPKGMKAGKPTVKSVQWAFEDGKAPPSEQWIPWVHGQSLITVLKEADEWEDNGQTVAETAGAANDGSDDEVAF